MIPKSKTRVFSPTVVKFNISDCSDNFEISIQDIQKLISNYLHEGKTHIYFKAGYSEIEDNILQSLPIEIKGVETIWESDEDYNNRIKKLEEDKKFWEEKKKKDKELVELKLLKELKLKYEK